MQASATARLLGLQFRIPPGARMFVLCVVNKDKKAKFSTIKTKTDEVQTEYHSIQKIPPGALISVSCECCFLCLCDESVTRPEEF